MGDIEILHAQDAQIFNSWPKKLRSSGPTKNPSHAAVNFPELCGEHLPNLKDSIFGSCVEVARYISWKFTFFLKPEKSPRRQVKRHLNIPSRVIHSSERKKRRERWMNLNGAKTFFCENLNSVPSSASASAQFNIHESWSKPPTRHSFSLPRPTKNGKSSLVGVKKGEKEKVFHRNESWIDAIHKTWAASERDDHENMIKSF